MLMVRIPGEECAGKVFDAMVTHLDVFPTLVEVLGLQPKQPLDGTSLLPLIRGETDRLHEEIFAETNFHAAREPQRAVRTDRWKYVRRYLDGPTVMPNIDDSPTKQFLYERGRFAQPVPSEQLYDLSCDPMEGCNLAAEPRCADVLADLRGRLERWQQGTNDPLLTSELTLQPGQIAHADDGLFAKRRMAPRHLPGCPLRGSCHASRMNPVRRFRIDSIYSAAAAHRKPRCPVEVSGVFAVRAEQR